MVAETEGPVQATAPPLTETFSQVFTDASGLLKAETTLAKAETAENARRLGIAVGSIAAGLGLVSVAVVLLLVALIVALAQAIGLLWSLLLVAGVILLTGLVLALGGRARMRDVSLVPRKSIERLRGDFDRLSGGNEAAPRPGGVRSGDGGVHG